MGHPPQPRARLLFGEKESWLVCRIERMDAANRTVVIGMKHLSWDCAIDGRNDPPSAKGTVRGSPCRTWLDQVS